MSSDICIHPWKHPPIKIMNASIISTNFRWPLYSILSLPSLTSVPRQPLMCFFSKCLTFASFIQMESHSMHFVLSGFFHSSYILRFIHFLMCINKIHPIPLYCWGIFLFLKLVYTCICLWTFWSFPFWAFTNRAAVDICVQYFVWACFLQEQGSFFLWKVEVQCSRKQSNCFPKWLYQLCRKLPYSLQHSVLLGFGTWVIPRDPYQHITVN